MRLPSADALSDLVGWETPYGVLSVYLEVDPGDRGGPWRIELRDQLDEVLDGLDVEDRTQRGAIEATAGRIRERFEAQAPPSGRMQIGFVACSPKPDREAREEWYGVQYPVEGTDVVYGERPNVRRLAEILDDGRPRALAALSAERVRLFEWRHGAVEELDKRELEIFALDWRERKAQRVRDPASGQGVSSAGRDQFDQRLEENRRRFLKEIGGRASRELPEDCRHELLCIGDSGLCEAFVSGWEQAPERFAVDHHDVITEPVHSIAERATAKIAEVDAERDGELVDRAIGAASAPNGAGALGPADTARALARGQVGRLLIDADRELPADGVDDELRAELEAVMPMPSGRLDEWIIEEAIHTSADITAVRAQPADRLAEHGGVGAILRFNV